MDMMGIPKFEYDFTVDRYSIYGLNRYRNFSTAERDTELTIRNMSGLASEILFAVNAANPAIFVISQDALRCYFINDIYEEDDLVEVCEVTGAPDDLWFFKQLDGAYLFDRYTLLIQTDKYKYIIG